MKNIIIGIVGATTFMTTIYVRNSIKFSKTQKVISYIAILVPPLQWLLVLLFSITNNKVKVKKKSKNKKKRKNKSNDDARLLEKLHKKNVLSKKEFEEKIEIVKSKNKESILFQTDEYKSLKSLYESGLLSKDELEEKLKNLNFDISKKNKLSQFKLTSRNFKLKSFNINGQIKELKRNILISFNSKLGFSVSNGKKFADGIYKIKDPVSVFEHSKLKLSFKEKADGFYYLEKKWEIIINDENSFTLTRSKKNNVVLTFSSI